jgi:hypothetical protein
MAMTITEQNWRAIRAATLLATDLLGLMELMRDNRASEPNVRATLKAIQEKAEFVADFCRAAEQRTNAQDD